MRQENRAKSRPQTRQLLDTLRLLGYGDDLIEHEYTVWLGDRQVAADLVAFSRSEPKDMSTAALVVEFAEGAREDVWGQAAQIGRSLAAPIVGLADSAGLALATVTRDGNTHPLFDIPFGDLSLTTDVREHLSPRHIFEMKTGSRQPGLFPIDVSLLDYARQATEDRLAPRVERALIAAFDHLGYDREVGTEREALERSHQKASRLVVGALAALVLRDKEDFPKLSAGALLDTILQRHPSEFSWVQALSPLELDGLTGTVAGLGADINFKSLDPLVLSGVYESTLVSDITRRQLGTHYTPPGLSRRMLAELPVELIPPGDRSVLDPTCGSGSLLLAAHDRLRSLQPTEWNLAQSHRDLAEHLRGFDTDAFAVEIARLSLLLHAMPAGNGWDVRQRDALLERMVDADRPSIVVANPPWRNTNTANGRRVEAADDFLRWMLASLRPGGLLAVVLPVGWLQNRSSREARAVLRESCDLFEVWRLPKGAFESGNMAPAVLFAQKQTSAPSRKGPILFRRVFRKSDLGSFYRGLSGGEAYLADPDKIEESGPLLSGPLTASFRGREGATVSSVAAVRAGPQPVAGFAARPTEDSNCLYLARLRDMRAFSELSEESLKPVRFPDDFQTGRGAVGLGRRKVIVPAASGPDTPWRLWTALDHRGVLVRNSMHMVIPHDDDETHLFGLTAFLASAFASCWIDERAVERNISTADVLSIPSPSRRLDWVALAELGREGIRVAAEPDALGEVARAIDELVWRTLDVPSEVQTRLVNRLSDFVAPEGVHRYANSATTAGLRNRGKPRSRFGIVLEVAEQRMLIEVIGVTSSEGVWVEPPPGLPAALCRPGATFDVLIPDGASPEDGQYFYQPESWVDAETLMRDPAYHDAHPVVAGAN
ncbi:N-6 DNA methylase [Micromonospora sp. NPDC049044]|uniref:N-6 DNA methylase n=1 Tax=Micromonospora sp. NPDC049044 TaxID=3154827 RepID=UPI0033F5E94C